MKVRLRAVSQALIGLDRVGLMGAAIKSAIRRAVMAQMDDW